MTEGAPDLVALRRRLHRVPELGFEERVTSGVLLEALSPLGAARSIARTGWVLDIGPPDAERTLLLRADMDGLPVTEQTGLPFSSTHPGRMHACGHDAHMACLASAAPSFAETLPRGLRLRLLFQPAEEGCGGAKACIDDGVLDQVDYAFGFHVWNELPTGTVVTTPGGMMAGVVAFEITVTGKGGHGALPERCIDPIVAASQLVCALQSIVSRRTAPLDAAVITVGALQAGEAFNVIPDVATLKGTVRYHRPEQGGALEEEMRRVARGIGEASGAQIHLEWTPYTPPTVNDPQMAALVADAARSVEGVTEVLSDYRVMAGEDFGEILARVPGCYALLGSGGVDPSSAAPHHSPRFQIDEAVLPIGRALHRAVVERVGQAGEFLHKLDR